MEMFCYQCQETAKGSGCTVQGVCGKNPELACLQDLLVYTLKGIAQILVKVGKEEQPAPELHQQVINSLFMTITNANFDPDRMEQQIRTMLSFRDRLREDVGVEGLHDAATFTVGDTREDLLAKAIQVGVLSTKDEDIRSLRELITYGLKGMAAYTQHAANLGQEDQTLNAFFYRALAKTLDDTLSVEDLLSLTLQTGEMGVQAMALLDKGNTARFGKPEITQVKLGVNDRPAILVSGHDLTDLEQLLEQTKDSGVDVYTHSEMLPAHSYPAFKKYEHFIGNYGSSWWKQTEEFPAFHGPILFTTNCIVPPKSQEVRDRIFTTGSAGFPGCKHIPADAEGKKDFSEIIALAKTLPAPESLEEGEILGGFAHDQLFALTDKILEAVSSGAIRKFVVMAGCDGRMKAREYYREFAEKLPKDTVILTAGCAKYRYNKLNLGEIQGIPRVLDAGQCNDSYSLAVLALKLKEILKLEDINDLPIVYNIAWYEQKAVIVLLALLSLGVKKIHLGPTLPGFLSPNVAKVLVEQFGIAGIGSVEEDLDLLVRE